MATMHKWQKQEDWDILGCESDFCFVHDPSFMQSKVKNNSSQHK